MVPLALACSAAMPRSASKDKVPLQAAAAAAACCYPAGVHPTHNPAEGSEPARQPGGASEPARQPRGDSEPARQPGGASQPARQPGGASEPSCPPEVEETRANKRRSRPVRSKTRRIAANVRERKRILDYNQAFNALRLSLKHDLNGKRLSKIATLRRAISKIASLSMFLRSAPPQRWPCSHAECQSLAQEPSMGEDSYLAAYQTPAHLPPEAAYGDLDHLSACPSPYYPKCPPESPFLLQQPPGARDESSMAAPQYCSNQAAAKTACHHHHADPFADPSPLPFAWQFNYFPGTNYQQTLPIH
ncbi:class A basic helix-loop-helix protein 9-like [Scyliorhinus canicula]|uniref:class A basic helix-loop-helix protein 9-like n=1 Tax=Scyliorhinus canicula TaxID=7830 RepID=UPI0018F712E6|nr:class A basic helix-loop-helix protein 9-like [Scyliorhinus canicula]